MKDERHIIERILHYCETIERARMRFGDSFKDFAGDDAYQLACDMAVLQIGELSTHLSAEFIVKYSDVPWKKLRGARNFMAHGYETLDIEQAWNTLTDSVPVLKQACIRILKQMGIAAQIAEATAALKDISLPVQDLHTQKEAAYVPDELER